jgi:hypothetical protein
MQPGPALGWAGLPWRRGQGYGAGRRAGEGRASLYLLLVLPATEGGTDVQQRIHALDRDHDSG